MKSTVRKIGVLTSGGDAPGMNAAIRAVVRTALFKGIRVMGIRRGYHGLIQNDIFEMNIRSVSEIIHRGGTVLYTARSSDFMTMEGFQRAVNNCKENGLDGLVCIGGDGTFKGALELSKAGIPCIGIPGTIDNDIPCTDYTIGFDTAMNTAVEMIDKLRDTIQSHDRCSVVEVMGHEVGTLAANIGLACGALTTLVPEKKMNLDYEVIDRMLFTQRTGKTHFIIVIAEGCGDSNEVAHYIQEKTGIESRVTVLGHVQRGGVPSVQDRIYATRFGHLAVELLASGKSGRVVAHKDGQFTDYDINEALSMSRTFDDRILEISKMISL